MPTAPTDVTTPDEPVGLCASCHVNEPMPGDDLCVVCREDSDAAEAGVLPEVLWSYETERRVWNNPEAPPC